ncbi:MAG TPA: TraR/DksA C4-type zinc finger protein [Cyclobacteriaceae bacterium]|nr:TraR/DksA C4-type zinc finger protein [Cyclobacteriaceae bacterium]
MAKKASGKGSVSAKAKKATKAKVPARKANAKPAKKAAASKVVAKAETIKKAAPVKKETTAPAPKPQHNLNIFPALTQRPIAHKPKTTAATDDKTRYSDDELKEFEVLIKNKLENSREEFKILKETLNRNNDAGTDSTSGGNTKVLEDGAETAEKENLSQLAARQLKYITNLENALVRIKNRTYGICTVTGKLIPKERLIAVPHTTQSIEAKMMQHD